MLKKCVIIFSFILVGVTLHAQNNSSDTTINPVGDNLYMDTTLDYDKLFSEFSSFLDSILTPQSYFLASVSVGKGNFNSTNKNTFIVSSSKQLIYLPTIGYYHRNGLGLTAASYITEDEGKMALYQFAITPSYDYLNNRDLATGISFTKYITKDSLSFYTTPLQNEVYGYFTYRKWWMKPMVAFSYGWGSRSDYEERESLIEDLRLRRRGFTYINSEETVSDFSITTSVRHDFYWLHVFSKKDHIRLSPQLSFTSGTQKFGFNQSSNTYVTVLRTGNNVLYNSDNAYLDDKINFQPLSLNMYLRTEYSIGKFFIQPQVTFDYYFPAATNNFNTLFSVNAGVIL